MNRCTTNITHQKHPESAHESQSFSNGKDATEQGLLTVPDPELGANVSVLFTSAGALVYQWQYALLNWR